MLIAVIMTFTPQMCTEVVNWMQSMSKKWEAEKKETMMMKNAEVKDYHSPMKKICRSPKSHQHHFLKPDALQALPFPDEGKSHLYPCFIILVSWNIKYSLICISSQVHLSCIVFFEYEGSFLLPSQFSGYEISLWWENTKTFTIIRSKKPAV